MLEDIGNISLIKKTNSNRFSLFLLHPYPYGSLSLLRQFTSKRELIRYVVTRIVTYYLSLQKLYQEK